VTGLDIKRTLQDKTR